MFGQVRIFLEARFRANRAFALEYGGSTPLSFFFDYVDSARKKEKKKAVSSHRTPKRYMIGS